MFVGEIPTAEIAGGIKDHVPLFHGGSYGQPQSWAGAPDRRADANSHWRWLEHHLGGPRRSPQATL